MPGIWEEVGESAAFALGAAALIGGSSLLGRAIDPVRGRRISILAAALGVIVCSTTLAPIGRSRATWLPPLLLVAAVSLWSLAQLEFVRRSARKFARLAANRTMHGVVLLGAGLGLVAWCGLSATEEKPSAAPQPETFSPVEMLRPVDSPIARTDKGRLVRLFSMPEFILPSSTLALLEADLARDSGLTLRVIRREKPSAESDCHGWIFADARWWIVGEDVPVILEDNGYEQVTEPRVGDLVIYRYGRKLITHSGIVFSRPNVGEILVESKWSWLGTYLHEPDAHPYGGSAEYYRSPRQGHRLAIQSGQ